MGIEIIEIKVKKLICDKCKYTWTSQSNKLRVSCPSCCTKVKTYIDDKTGIIEEGLGVIDNGNQETNG